MRSRVGLLLWLVGILFPMVLVGKIWPAFGNVFDSLFAPDWVHVVMHALLYSVLGFLIASFIPLVSLKPVLLSSFLLLLIGIVQESLQLFSARLWPGWQPELFDLGVDLLAGLAGLGLFSAWKQLRRSHR